MHSKRCLVSAKIKTSEIQEVECNHVSRLDVVVFAAESPWNLISVKKTAGGLLVEGSLRLVCRLFDL